MKGRRVPPEEIEETQWRSFSQRKNWNTVSLPLTLETLQNAAKIHAGVPYTMTHKLTEAERQAACEDVAQRMYAAGMGWNLDAILKLTSSEMDLARRFLPFKMPEPTPAERGVLDRFQRKARRHDAR